MKKLLVTAVLLAGLFSTAEAADTLSIVEPPPYFHGQTIHVVTSPLHGKDEQRLWCTQNGAFVISESNAGGIYILDTYAPSMPWNPLLPASCEAFIWNGFNPNTRHAIVSFTVLP